MSDNEDEEFEEMYFSEEGSPSSGEEEPLQGPGPSAQMLQEKELQEAVSLKRKQERVNMDPRVPQKRVTFYEEEDMEGDFFCWAGERDHWRSSLQRTGHPHGAGSSSAHQERDHRTQQEEDRRWDYKYNRLDCRQFIASRHQRRCLLTHLHSLQINHS